MDPVTQAALGAVTAQVASQRRLGPRVALIGALAGAAPDIDVLFAVGGDWFDQLVLHRGITHSLFFAPVVGPLLGWLVWRLEQWHAARGRPGTVLPGEDGGRLGWWVLAVSLALLSHPLLDVLTTYGTQLLQPFSDQRFAINAMPIIDPLYTSLLLLGSWLAIRMDRRLPPRRATSVALACLLISSGYLALGWQQNRTAESLARAQLTAAGIRDAEVSAFPTLLQIHYRRVVARTADTDRVGYISTWTPCAIVWGQGARGPLAGVDAFLASREGQIFHWFTMGWTRFVPGPPDQPGLVRAVDLRYGLDNDPDASLFAVRVSRSTTADDVPERPYPEPGVLAMRDDSQGPVTDRLTSLVRDTYAPTCRVG